MDDCLACFHLFVIMNKTGMIIYIQVLHIHFLYWEKLLAHMANIYEMLYETVKLFPKVVLPFLNSTSNV